jgi:co-chaperonin GroES (HSP10)
MHNSNLLQVKGYSLPNVPHYAYDAITCTPGKVAVQMSGQVSQIGSIYIPSTVGGKLRCDVGIVLSCAPPKDKNGRPYEMDIKPGDAVLVRPYDGTWFDGFTTGKYSTEDQVRIYGIAATPGLYETTKGQSGEKSDTGTYETTNWNDSIVAKLVGNVVVPTLGNLMIALENEKHEFLALPDGMRMPTQTAHVAAPGSSGFKRGDRVAWIPSPDDLSIEYGEELRIIRLSQVEACIG